MILPMLAAGCAAWVMTRPKATRWDDAWLNRDQDLERILAAGIRNGITQRDDLRLVTAKAVWPEATWPPTAASSPGQWYAWQVTGTLVCRALSQMQGYTRGIITQPGGQS